MQSGDMPAVTLRRGTPDDALCVGVLAMQVFLDTYAIEGIRPDLAREVLATYAPEAFAERLRDASTIFLLAERGIHLVGFAEVALGRAPPAAATPDAAELVRLYVQRRNMRQGLGSALLGLAEDIASEHSAGCVWLTVWSGNASAQHFYAARGYRDSGATQYAFQGNVYENRILKRTLPDAR